MDNEKELALLKVKLEQLESKLNELSTPTCNNEDVANENMASNSTASLATSPTVRQQPSPPRAEHRDDIKFNVILFGAEECTHGSSRFSRLVTLITLIA